MVCDDSVYCQEPSKGFEFWSQSLKDIAKCLLKQQLINRHTGNNIDITFSTIVIDYIICNRSISHNASATDNILSIADICFI